MVCIHYLIYNYLNIYNKRLKMIKPARINPKYTAIKRIDYENSRAW